MDLSKKVFVYHRALNTQEAFEAFLQKNKASNYTLAAEGDVCWAYIDNKYVIYIHHPDVQGKALSNEEIKALLQKDQLFTLEKLFEINSDVHFILELKTGNGDLHDFLVAFKEILQRYNVNNALVDAFSAEQLKALKSVMPEIQTSLHTKFLMGNYVLETTFEKPYVRLHKISDMDYVNYFTISYTTTHVNLFNLDINSAYSAIFQANKHLNLGSIKSLTALSKALHANVEYIYLRSDEVKENYEQFIQQLEKK